MKKSIFPVSMAAALLCAGGALAQIRPPLPAPGEAPAGSPVAVHGALKVSGGAITDKSGTAVVLRGMSFDWSDNAAFGAYYNANVIGWLTHDWRISVIRAAMTVHSGDNDGDKCDGDPGYTDSPAGASANGGRVKAVVEAAIERGIYVIIDWHMHKLTPSCGPNSGKNLTSNASTFFGDMAKQYGKYPNVIYEVWNEPIGDNWVTISSYANTVISSIRSNGGDGVVVVGSPQWSSQPNGATGVSDSKSNVAYTLHFYANEHQSSGGYNSNMKSAVGGNPAKAVFATEWGTTNADGDKGHNEGQSTSWINDMETSKVGWANWRISHAEQGSAALKSSGSGGGPWASSILTPSGGYVRGKIRGYNDAAYKDWKTTYPIDVTVEGSGTVEKRVGTTLKPGPYDYGDKVSLKAVPAAGYIFDHWEGDATGGNAAPTAYTITGFGLKIKAVFVQGSMIKNGMFTNNTDSWDAVGITISLDAGTLKATVNEATAYILQSNVGFTSGTKYTLSFRAKAASGGVTIIPRATNRGGSTVYWTGDPAALTADWKEFSGEFCMSAASDATGRIRFQSDDAAGKVWNLDDVSMDASGTCEGVTEPPECEDDDCNPQAVLLSTVKGHKSAWSVSRIGGTLTLRGPVEAGATATLYDTRGRVLRRVAAVDGLTLGAGVPAGSYMLVVKNGKGGEAYRARVLIAR